MSDYVRENSRRTLTAMLDLSPLNYKTVFSGMVQIIILKAWEACCCRRQRNRPCVLSLADLFAKTGICLRVKLGSVCIYEISDKTPKVLLVIRAFAPVQMGEKQ